MPTSRTAPAPGLRALRRALILALGMGAASCAGTARNPFAPAGTQQTQIYIQVENRGFNDVRLYAQSARGARSLGPVEGNTVKRLTLDWRQVDQLSFRIEVLAGRTYNTHAVSAGPGDHVDLIIQTDPANSYLRVR